MLIYSLWFSLIWITIISTAAFIWMYNSTWTATGNFWILLINIPVIVILIELVYLGGIHVK